ncbi:symbiotic chitinase [Parachaetomium inaequale]|uniref:chitinase n=1 Tax=Parachaetomium inaequale TaxID=2588326 RepID=A0AAN6PBU3_9PEZI|nr:symbiotic chitinase [Parachaetomium inaequale]
MDGRTPPSLFRETTNLKSLKPGIEVWVSVGGWTFSDNGGSHATPARRDRAGSLQAADLCQQSAALFEEYAFDGFDLDWEYPRAPDRGGKPDDRRILKLGISFTIPPSYWYLRWFKVPELLQYSDFTSLMSYDLHGLWDKENLIGNVINPHTNLTEIKRAVELLWRVGVPPSKIALGFGFYGRSFRLADPSCTTPGVCQFSGDPDKGPRTDTSGYLSYYEIQDLIGPPSSASSAARRDIGNNVTLETRQSGVGFAGSLIWASDLDDNLIQAHQGLVGRAVPDNDAARRKGVGSSRAASDMNKGLNEACRRLDGVCGNVNSQDSLVQNCRQEGMELVGWDAMGCGKDLGTPICCEKDSIPHSCAWRGGQSSGLWLHCNGQCNNGEVQLFGSSNGGFPGAENSNLRKCTRGIKSFCCTQNDYEGLVRGCAWHKW